MRTLFLTIALCLSLAACGDDKKPDSEPEPATEADESAGPTPAPPPAKTGEVKRMNPNQVKKEVDRAGKEYTDKVDESLDL